MGGLLSKFRKGGQREAGSGSQAGQDALSHSHRSEPQLIDETARDTPYKTDTLRSTKSEGGHVSRSKKSGKKSRGSSSTLDRSEDELQKAGTSRSSTLDRNKSTSFGKGGTLRGLFRSKSTTLKGSKSSDSRDSLDKKQKNQQNGSSAEELQGNFFVRLFRRSSRDLRKKHKEAREQRSKSEEKELLTPPNGDEQTQENDENLFKLRASSEEPKPMAGGQPSETPLLDTLQHDAEVQNMSEPDLMEERSQALKQTLSRSQELILEHHEKRKQFLMTKTITTTTTTSKSIKATGDALEAYRSKEELQLKSETTQASESAEEIIFERKQIDVRTKKAVTNEQDIRIEDSYVIIDEADVRHAAGTTGSERQTYQETRNEVKADLETLQWEAQKIRGSSEAVVPSSEEFEVLHVTSSEKPLEKGLQDGMPEIADVDHGKQDISVQLKVSDGDRHPSLPEKVTDRELFISESTICESSRSNVNIEEDVTSPHMEGMMKDKSLHMSESDGNVTTTSITSDRVSLGFDKSNEMTQEEDSDSKVVVKSDVPSPVQEGFKDTHEEIQVSLHELSKLDESTLHHELKTEEATEQMSSEQFTSAPVHTKVCEVEMSDARSEPKNEWAEPVLDASLELSDEKAVESAEPETTKPDDHLLTEHDEKILADEVNISSFTEDVSASKTDETPKDIIQEAEQLEREIMLEKDTPVYDEYSQFEAALHLATESIPCSEEKKSFEDKHDVEAVISHDVESDLPELKEKELVETGEALVSEQERELESSFSQQVPKSPETEGEKEKIQISGDILSTSVEPSETADTEELPVSERESELESRLAELIPESAESEIEKEVTRISEDLLSEDAKKTEAVDREGLTMPTEMIPSDAFEEKIQKEIDETLEASEALSTPEMEPETQQSDDKMKPVCDDSDRVPKETSSMIQQVVDRAYSAALDQLKVDLTKEEGDQGTEYQDISTEVATTNTHETCQLTRAEIETLLEHESQNENPEMDLKETPTSDDHVSDSEFTTKHVSAAFKPLGDAWSDDNGNLESNKPEKEQALSEVEPNRELQPASDLNGEKEQKTLEEETILQSAEGGDEPKEVAPTDDMATTNQTEVPEKDRGQPQDSVSLPDGQVQDSHPEQVELKKAENESYIEQEFVWEHGGQEVYLCASFNNWATVPMSVVDGVHKVKMELPEGSYYYTYIVDGETMGNPTQAMEGDMNFIEVKKHSQTASEQ